MLINLRNHIKQAYQTVLFCWPTVVVLICFSCNTGVHHYNYPNGSEKGHLKSSKDLNSHSQDGKEKSIYERFEAAWASKIKTPSKEEIIKEMVSTIPQCAQAEEWVALKRPIAWFIETVGLPMPQWLQAEGLTKPERQLLETFVDQNTNFFIEQHIDLYQQRKRLFLELPDEKLQPIVPILEASEDIDKFIQTFLRSTPDYVVIDRLVKANVRLTEKIWECFAEWIRKPEISLEYEKEMLQKIQEDLPKKMPKEDREWIQKSIIKQTLKKVEEGMVEELLAGMPKKIA